MADHNDTRDYFTRQYDEARRAGAERQALLATLQQLRSGVSSEIDLTNEAVEARV